jgi:hypothetical protein
MVLLGAKSITVDDVTVFPDHADPNQFWYLPSPVALAKRSDNQSAFTFIKYKPAVVQSGVKGGGFCMFDVALHLDPSVEQSIKGKLSELGSGTGTPTLSPVQFDSGTVKCVALNLEGSDGTKASPAPPGAFNAVEEIQGASIPSLAGDEDAIFSLTLSQEGAIILQQAFEQGTGPIGVIYDLKYTGIRPALKVKITADFKRIYQSLSISLSAQYYFLKAGLDAEFEKLVQDGSIVIEVLDFTGDADEKQKEQWALDFFKDKLLNDWFEPTLKPGEIEGGAVSTSLPGATDPTQKAAQAAGQARNQASQGTQGASKQGAGGGSQPASSAGQTGAGAGGQATGAGAGAGGKSTGAGAAAGGQQASASASAGTGGASAGAGAATAAAAATASAPAPAPSPLLATLTQTWTPNPPPAGYRLDFTPATSGTNETITVSGSNPTVKVDNLVRNLDSNHRITVDVAPGSSHTMDVDYPSAPATNQTFSLLFDFEDPQETWVAGNPGTNANYQSYLADKPNPADPQFNQSTAPNNTTATGAAALRQWISTLADPKSVAISAHASFEGDATSAKQAYNMRLSGRRADVARGIIGTLATISATDATGQTEAMNAGRLRDAKDRVARVTGMTAAGTPQTSVHATISRPPTPSTPQGGQPQGGQPQGGQPQGGQPQGGQPPQTQQQQQSSDGSAAIAFKLRFVDQEEQKTMVFEYSRQDAVQRTYAPQGLFGLMLTDLSDEDKHFVEVDLDDPFFRVFEVDIDAPVDFKSIGLTSAHVSIDYGDPADVNNFKHGDFLFDEQNHAQQKFQAFMDANHDTSYTYTVEYHFDPESGWDGTKTSYQLPPKTTTDRSLSIDPHDQIGFLAVNVIAHEVDWGTIDSVDVRLSQALRGGPVQQKTVTLSNDLQSQFWRVRVDAPGPAEYTFSCTHHLKDGTTRDTEPTTSRASVLPINDPFESSIEIDFIPLFDQTRTRMAFIDIAYDDPDNNYHRAERLTLAPSAKDAIHQRISLMNPALKTYQYRITSVGTNNQMQRGDFVSTTETLIGVF